MAQTDNAQELFTLAVTLGGVITRMFRKTGHTELSTEPIIEKKPIIEFMRRMRVFGMEKFATPTFISTINYYVNVKDMEEHRALGVIIVYIEQDFVARLLRLLQYPLIDEDDEEALKDASGTLCNVIAGQFKSEIAQLGFIEVEMSHFSSYRNTAFHGVEFCMGQREKYEISFNIQEKKRLVVEMTMGSVPKAQKR